MTLALALARRASLQNSHHTNAYRLIHRVADGFANLTVDKYAEVLVANVYSAGLTVKPPLTVLRELAVATESRAIYVKYRPTQASKLSKADLEALAPLTPLWGAAVEQTIIKENNLQFIIRPADGLSTGLFLDMREMRAWVRAHAHGQTVLNCFAYTCGFGVAALAGGAIRAVNIDVSKKYLAWGKENTALNSFAVDDKDFISGDVFDWLKRFTKRKQQFGVVILDPPPYSTTKESRFSIQRDYAELLELALKVVAPNGYLIAGANAVELTEKSFVKQIKQSALSMQPPAKLVEIFHEPELDFPSEEKYLKVCVVQK